MISWQRNNYDMYAFELKCNNYKLNFHVSDHQMEEFINTGKLQYGRQGDHPSKYFHINRDEDRLIVMINGDINFELDTTGGADIYNKASELHSTYLHTSNLVN